MTTERILSKEQTAYMRFLRCDTSWSRCDTSW